MAAVVPFLQIAGTIFSAVSAISQGMNANAAGQRNAQINQQNAVIAHQNADAQNVQNQHDNYMRLGAIRANQGKSGGTGDSGSVLDVLGDVAAQGELDKQYTTYQADLQARGYINTANLDSASGSNALKTGVFKAGSELLSGGSDYYMGRSRLVRT